MSEERRNEMEQAQTHRRLMSELVIIGLGILILVALVALLTRVRGGTLPAEVVMAVAVVAGCVGLAYYMRYGGSK